MVQSWFCFGSLGGFLLLLLLCVQQPAAAVVVCRVLPCFGPFSAALHSLFITPSRRAGVAWNRRTATALGTSTFPHKQPVKHYSSTKKKLLLAQFRCGVSRVCDFCVSARERRLRRYHRCGRGRARRRDGLAAPSWVCPLGRQGPPERLETTSYNLGLAHVGVSPSLVRALPDVSRFRLTKKAVYEGAYSERNAPHASAHQSVLFVCISRGHIIQI